MGSLDCCPPAPGPNRFVPDDLSSFFLSLFFAFAFAGFSVFVGEGEPAGAAATRPGHRAAITHTISKTNTANLFIPSGRVLQSDGICQ